MSRIKKDISDNINTLKLFFFIHFAIDILIAIPLFLSPEGFLTFLGWQVIDPLSARLVSAALFAIGIESLLVRNSGLEAFNGMLNLKIIWSATAIVALGISILQEGQMQNALIWRWGMLIIFLVFNFIWIYWKIRLKRMLKNIKTP